MIASLRSAGIEVVERHATVWERRRHKWSPGLGSMLRVAGAETSLVLGRKGAFDAMIVGYPGHFDMPAARRIARRRPLVFNPLVSLEDTLVGDRARYRPGTPGASVLRQIDRIAFRRADLVVADTIQHAHFFASRFELPPERLEVCLLGADDALFRPGWQPPGSFHALFVGKLIPLHGLETILGAAAIATEVSFRIVGSGQLQRLLDDRPANVEWVPWIEYEDLPAAYRSAGCALGIFGTSDKARRVIPNKAYQALACGAPLITGDTPAARELLADGRDALLVPTGDPAALAVAVRRLAAEPVLARELAAAGRRTYEQAASEEVLGRRWRTLLVQLVGA